MCHACAAPVTKSYMFLSPEVWIKIYLVTYNLKIESLQNTTNESRVSLGKPWRGWHFNKLSSLGYMNGGNLRKRWRVFYDTRSLECLFLLSEALWQSQVSGRESILTTHCPPLKRITEIHFLTCAYYRGTLQFGALCKLSIFSLKV